MNLSALRSHPRLARALLLGGLAALALWWRTPQLGDRDLGSYYAAGQLTLDGRPEAAYDRAELVAAYRRESDSPLRPGPWLYSPVWLPAAALLARVPLAEAVAWSRAVGAAALGLGLALVLVRVRSAPLAVALAVAFALAHPAWVQLIYLNWTMFLFLLVALAALAGERGREGIAALAWALGIHLKGFIALALAGAAVGGRGRIAVRTLAAGALLAALVLPVVGTASYLRFFAFARSASVAGVTPYYNKLSLQATIARFQSEPRDWVRPRGPVRTLAVRALFWLALPLGLLGLRRLRRHPDAALAFALAFVLLAVPQVWDHTEILLFVALPALPRRYAWALAALLGASALYNGMQQPLLAAVVAGERPPWVLQSLLLYFPALALLTAGAALRVAEEHGEGAVASVA